MIIIMRAETFSRSWDVILRDKTFAVMNTLKKTLRIDIDRDANGWRDFDGIDPLTINGELFFFSNISIVHELIDLTLFPFHDKIDNESLASPETFDIKEAFHVLTCESIDRNGILLNVLNILYDFIRIVDPLYYEVVFSRIVDPFSVKLTEMDFLQPFFESKERPYQHQSFTEALEDIPGGRQALIATVLEAAAKVVRESSFYANSDDIPR